MASSISEAAKEKTVAESASAILEAEPSLKKWKAQMNPETAENASNSSDFSFPPLTTEVSHTVHNMDFAEAPNNVEVPSPRGSDAVDNEFFQIPEGYRQRYDRCIDELEKVNIFDDPAARHELAEFLLIPPEEKNYIEGLTTVEALSYVQECMVKVLVGLFQHRREFYALKGDFEKAKATISDQNAEISALKVNSNKLAKAEAELKENELSWAQLSSRVESLETKLKWKDSELSQAHLRSEVESQEAELKRKEYELSKARLISKVESLEAELKGKESELSQAHLSCRVESLEAELKRKQAENEVLKNLVVASEQKASSAKQKTLSLEKKIIDVEQKKSAAGFKEKSQNPEANLLLCLASSNPT